MTGPNSKNGHHISVVVPACNEALYIYRCVELVEKKIQNLTDSYEIILAEDGSTDGTSIVAAKIARQNPRVFHIHSDERLGRGRALKTAFSYAKGETLIYLDADLASGLSALSSLINAVKEDYSVASGSRHLKGSRVKRPISRWAASIVYNLLVRVIFRDGVHDHQCGFKAFRRELLDSLLDSIDADDWFWDTEILIKSSRSGYSVTEVPIEWTENRGRGESKVNLLNDSIRFIKNLMRLWLELNLRHEVNVVQGRERLLP